MIRILVIKNGNCDTDIEYILNKVDPMIKVDIMLSKNIMDFNRTDVIDLYHGVIILGGYQTLTERHNTKYQFPYLNTLIEYTKYWIEQKVNLLGICLGAQIIGEAVGYRTVRLSRYCSGYNKNIKIITDDKILKDGMISLLPYVLSSHYDKIDVNNKVDQSSTLNNENDNLIHIIGTYEIDDTTIPYIFKVHNTSVYGVQFHPEITRNVFDSLQHCFAFDLCTKQFMIDNEKIILNTSILFMKNWIDSWIKIDT